jgi:hypothetical protein
VKKTQLVTALVRKMLPPHNQVVYIRTQVPAEAVSVPDVVETDLFAMGDDPLADEAWSPQERATFAGIASALIFFGFLIGKAF